MELQLGRWIREHTETSAVELARRLCMAEASRHGLPLDTVSITGRVKVGDQGIDGRTLFPTTIDSLFPLGPCVWQIKSGSTTPSHTTEFNPEKHAGLIDAIKNGADYVLFWTFDPTDVVRSNVETGFTTAVQQARRDANVRFLFGDQIERLCYQHLSVLAQSGPAPLRGLVGLKVWERTFELIDFEADEKRLTAIDILREHATHEREPHGIHIIGDTGVGKSRLVYQALSLDGLRERVLVVPDTRSWDRDILTHIANTEGSSLVLVVDDCDAESRSRIDDLVGMSQGRIRLITTGSRATRERHVENRRKLELLPLTIDASTKIARSKGLDEQEATRVADLTQGYPGIADRLAKAIAYGRSETTLLDRIRGDDEIGPVLAALVVDADVPLLGLISLFERIGFDGEVAPELGLACKAFGIDEAAVRRVADRELQKFVSTAGRFRRVTPKLFAIWLATRFLEMHTSTIVNELEELPEFLRQRIFDQMYQFAGDQVVSRTLGTLLEQAPFGSGAIADVDGGAARVIHVGSIVNPQAAMAAIERIMDGATTEELASARDGRRDLVEAIEVLLWSGDHFERAASAALRLAIAENERWSNNATGTVQRIYRVFLGGTSASYERRMAWTRDALSTFGEEAIPIIVPGLALAFDAHEFRMSTDFGGGVAPAEWRPATPAEETEARRLAWELLIEVAQRDVASRAAVANSLAQGLRIALLRGMSTEVLTSLETVEWPARGRAELIEALNHARSYDKPNPNLDAEIADLVAQLAGDRFEERARYVFAASVWELTDDRNELIAGLPGVLVDLAERAANSGAATWREMIELSREGNPDTTSRFFEELAKRAPSLDFESEMEELEPPPLPAVTGYLRGLAMVGAVDPVTVLERWSGREQLSASIIRAVHLLPATDELARLAIAAVNQGSSPAEDLGQFLYGAWTRTLNPDVVGSLLMLLGEAVRKRLDEGDSPRAQHALDHALGIADQWTEDNPMPPTGTPLRSALSDLLAISEQMEVGASGGSSMLDLHVAHIVPRMALTTAERLTMLLRRFQSLQSFPSEYTLKELDELIGAEPTEVLPALVEFLKSGADGSFNPWSLWLEDAKLLSRIQGEVDRDQLLELVVETGDPKTWSHLVSHVAFDTDKPDPLLVALLGRSDDAELRGRSMSQFMHPRSTYWGSESDYLKRRREVAARWRADPGLPALFAEWVDELVEALDADIRRAEEAEAEGRW
ncbi:hypothetical protein [Mycobacterium sp. MUNTM1]